MLIRNGTLFDGSGQDGVLTDVRVEDGRVTEIEKGLEPRPGERVVDAEGCWVTPGFVDLHTHYDAEVEISPALHESVRHGVTTCVMGSCSLGMAVGEPEDLADMFCRVEAIPREYVLPALKEVKDWNTPKAYLEHLDGLPLGPNMACMLGHSGLRAHVMGLGDALSKKQVPSKSELAQMDAILGEALDEGYIGLSISTLPWDKMDSDPRQDSAESFRSRPMPSVFARWSEYRHFAKTLRARGKVLQAVPNISTKVNIPMLFAMSAGVFRKGLKLTIISMMDIKADRFAFRIAGWLTRVINTVLGGDLRMQALPNKFDLWADGIDLVVFEELEAGTAALHLKGADRDKLLKDPAFRARFKKQWRNRFLPRAFHRNLADTEILDAPDKSLVGKSFKEVADERGTDIIDAFLDLVVEHGDDLRWYTVMGNDRPEWLEYIMKHPDILVGFSDAGAHLRQMSHYNFPLRLLNMVKAAQDAGKPFMSTGRAVQRLTSEIADWLELDAGHVAVGHRADLVVVDPAHLAAVEDVHYAAMPEFGLDRLVRRNDEAVRAVIINGAIASEHGVAAAELGNERAFGRVLRAGQEARDARGAEAQRSEAA